MRVDPRIPEAVVQRMVAKAQPLLTACIGQTKVFRLSPHLTQSGVITEAYIERIDFVLPHKAEAVFNVVMECGSAKTRKEFLCRKLPC